MNLKLTVLFKMQTVKNSELCHHKFPCADRNINYLVRGPHSQGGLQGRLSEFLNFHSRHNLNVSSELHIAVDSSFDATIVCHYFI